jgi:serine/threonine protein phosphatase PrpC
MMKNISVVYDQGGRDYQQDLYSIISGPEKDWLLVNIFDGHGPEGELAAAIANQVFTSWALELIKCEMSVLNAFQLAYKFASDAIPMDSFSGTCALNFLIKNGKIYVANAGDSELIIFRKKGYEKLTEVHRVGVKKEADRIIAFKGFVGRHYFYHSPDKKAGLAVTRSLGDYYFKLRGSVYYPALREYTIGPNDKWLVAASDGLFDLAAVDKLSQTFKGLRSVKMMTEVINGFVSQTVEEEDCDNLTAIVIDLRPLAKKAG